MIRGTRLCSPLSNILAGASGSTHPSTLGALMPTFLDGEPGSEELFGRQRRAGPRGRRPSAVAPSASAKLSPTASASPRLRIIGHGKAHALDDGAMKEAVRERGGQQVVDVGAARRFAEDRHPARVPSEGSDVALHPLEGRDLVEQRVVARRAVLGLRGQRRMGEQAEDVEAVVDGHDHHALAGEVGAVVQRLGSASGDVGAAVDPHHDGGEVVTAEVRGPDVEIEAVLADGRDDRNLRRVLAEGLGDIGEE